MDEDTAIKLKALIFDAFGGYPILDVSETWEIYDPECHEEPVNLRNYHALLDLENLDKIGEYEIGYVENLIRNIAMVRYHGKDHLITMASKKYCFSDTEDWWNAMVVDTVPAGREKFELIVELG